MKRAIPVLLDTSEIKARNFDFSSLAFKRLRELCDSGAADVIRFNAIDTEVEIKAKEDVDAARTAGKKFSRGDGRILYGADRPNPSVASRDFDFDAFTDQIITSYYKFLEDCRAVKIPEGHLDFSATLNWFRNGIPPFKTPGDSDGWVDALTLSAVSSWAARSGRSTYLVSRDGDWLRTSDRFEELNIFQRTEDCNDAIIRARPFVSFRGDADALTNHISNTSQDSSSHLTDFPLRSVSQEPVSIQPLPAADSFGDIITLIEAGWATASLTSRGSHIRTKTSLLDKVKLVANKFPSRIALYLRLRATDDYNFVRHTCHASWPEEYLFYATWLLNQYKYFSQSSIKSLGQAISVASWDDFASLVIDRIKVAYPGPGDPTCSNLRSAYALYGSTSEGAFQLTDAVSKVSLSKTGS